MTVHRFFEEFLEECQIGLPNFLGWVGQCGWITSLTGQVELNKLASFEAILVQNSQRNYLELLE